MRSTRSPSQVAFATGVIMGAFLILSAQKADLAIEKFYRNNVDTQVRLERAAADRHDALVSNSWQPPKAIEKREGSEPVRLPELNIQRSGSDPQQRGR